LIHSKCVILKAEMIPNMSEPNHDVCVVILNWNGKSFLEQFLPVVKKNTPDWVTLVVADNGSTDDSVDYLKEFHAEVKILTFKENLGFAGGYNAALSQLNAGYYVLLNSDIEVSPGWIEPGINLMESNPDVAACQPKILSYHDNTLFEHAGASGGFVDIYGYPFCRGRIFNTLEKETGQYDDAREVFWATGACMFVRADAFKAVGGFDERFFAHMEEIDMCWRLQNAGYKIMVCPESAVYHVGGGTLPKSNPNKTYLNFRNSLWMLAKNLPARIFYPTMIVRIGLDKLAAIHFLFHGQIKDCLAIFRAYIAFFKQFRSMRRSGEKTRVVLPPLLYKRSIVLQYYLFGKKRFSDINNVDAR
jgi:GT2 family glycosyltransferase